jgi:hypothetical protein
MKLFKSRRHSDRIKRAIYLFIIVVTAVVDTIPLCFAGINHLVDV